MNNFIIFIGNFNYQLRSYLIIAGIYFKIKFNGVGKFMGFRFKPLLLRKFNPRTHFGFDQSILHHAPQVPQKSVKVSSSTHKFFPLYRIVFVLGKENNST